MVLEMRHYDCLTNVPYFSPQRTTGPLLGETGPADSEYISQMPPKKQTYYTLSPQVCHVSCLWAVLFGLWVILSSSHTFSAQVYKCKRTSLQDRSS